MTDRELMQMALDALKYPGPSWPDSRQAIAEALRARLAQPEMVIQARKDGDLIVVDLPQVPTGGGGIFKDEQPEPLEYWNAVEGWVKIDEVRQHFDAAGCGTIYKTGGEGRVPLYAAREWVGLTDADIDDVQYNVDCRLYRDYARAIEAKLKEKNEN
ncbi:hypothetical protein UFOVP382_27 [uncultured Caudovirales phage]|uniref:Uncharacterized protein n=1 Tax=uncultured Caudovirales phage TaxID=2100421 RepID=A0A6J7WYZ9_9CAUD|nr:hypothetical protein UFOVP382_27 [uncultured Caudovirales phage]